MLWRCGEAAQPFLMGSGLLSLLLGQQTLEWWIITEWALKFLMTMKTEAEQTLWLFMKLLNICIFKAQYTELFLRIYHRKNIYVKPSVSKT